MKRDQITIRDIALKLGISIATVSRALRGAFGVNPETKKAVLEMAKKLNYKPNRVAQSLRNKKSYTLGIIVPELVTHFFSSNISAIQEVAAQYNYNVMIGQSNESLETEIQNTQTFIARRVDGLLMSLSKETNNYDHLELLYKKNIPLVLFDRIYEGLDVSKITVDDYEGAFRATEHLILQGCRRIAHISGPEELSICKKRLQGYLDALQQNNLPFEEELIRHCSLSKEDIIAHTNALLALPSPPDAFFSLNDPTAILILVILKEKGIKIPEEVAVVGFTNEPVSALIRPSLTTIALPAHQMGKIATTKILEQILNPEDFIPQSIMLKAKLLVRDSSRKRTT
jgi:DNA-binding LacI/PurR family transcriptional regulator